MGGEGASAWSRCRWRSAGPCTQVSLRVEKPALRSTVFSFIRLLSTEKAAAQSLKSVYFEVVISPRKPELGDSAETGLLVALEMPCLWLVQR